ncbi:hypothetical protein WEH80_06105 [Actinomycetes bacterium KLBMP 9759]
MARPKPAAQRGLWGRQQPLPDRPAAKTAINDLDLIHTVIAHATDPGYVLIGPAERVFTRDPATKDTVEPVPAYEQDAVAQLLGSGYLKVGGTHHVHYGRSDGPARSVLVAKAARSMLARWSALKPIT